MTFTQADIDRLEAWLIANPDQNTAGPVTLLDGVQNSNYAALRAADDKWRRANGMRPRQEKMT